jgi:formylglycine-generating enzyme required for sulfatase activity
MGEVKGFKDCDICPEMVVIPAGSFEMGATNSDEEAIDNESPRHHVNISNFSLGKTLITRRQFAAFVKDTDYQADDRCYTYEGIVMEENGPSIVTDGGAAERRHRSWQNPGFSQEDDHPAVCLNWNDAKAYIHWISEKTGKRYRLPSESEWEYAARVGTTTARYWGETEDQQCVYANGLDVTTWGKVQQGINWGVATCSDDFVYTAPVGSFKPNAFGLYDMAGNAWEWTEDCLHKNYDGAPTNGSAWIIGGLKGNAAACTRRVIRGGSWNSSPKDLRASRRGGAEVTVRDSTGGFRIARDSQ